MGENSEAGPCFKAWAAVDTASSDRAGWLPPTVEDDEASRENVRRPRLLNSTTTSSWQCCVSEA